jgi:hypothetical protein
LTLQSNSLQFATTRAWLYNLIVFGLPQPGLDSTIYHTPGDHTNNYTTDTVNEWNDNNRAFAYSYKIKIHFGLLDQIVLYIIILKTKVTRTEIFILHSYLHSGSLLSHCIVLYLCNQCLSLLKLRVQTPFMARCTRYNIDKVCQWLAAGQ